MNRTPTSITVVSILGIIYGGIILLAMPINLVVSFFPLTPNPMMDHLRADAGYMAVTLCSYALNFLLALLLLISSIGSIRLKKWGRSGMNIYAIAQIVLLVIGIPIAIFYTSPKALAAAADQPGAEFLRMFMPIGVACGALFVFAITGIILYFFNRKIAVDAFNGIFVATGTDFPIQMDEPPPPSAQV
jgi:hypothetical protein